MIQPGDHMVLSTDIAIKPNSNTYAQLLTRSSMACKGLSVLGGVIDLDYTGYIKVIIQNNSQQLYQIHQHDRIAQMVFKAISQPVVEVVELLKDTQCGEQGFGSTEEKEKALGLLHQTVAHNPTSTAKATTAAVNHDSPIDFSTSPYDNEMEIVITNTEAIPRRV